MTSQEKKIIFTAIGLMVVILLVVLGVKLFGKPVGEGNNTLNTPPIENTQNGEKYTTELSDGTKINNSESLKGAKTYKTVTISNIQFTSKDGNSVLLADVKNTGTTDFKEEDVELVLLDENNEEYKRITALIPNLKAGETEQINTIVTADFTNIKDFRIETKK